MDPNMKWLMLLFAIPAFFVTKWIIIGLTKWWDEVNDKLDKEKGQASILAMLIVLGMMLTIAAMSIPAVQGIQRRRNETQTIGNMQTIIGALNTYYSAYGNYPSSAVYLSNCSGPISSTNSCLLSAALIGTLNGYSFGYAAEVQSGVGNVGYKISETPTDTTQGATTYCATNSAPNPDSYPADGLIHGTLNHLFSGTAAACVGYQVYSNNGQGPMGPPGPVIAYHAITWPASGAFFATAYSQVTSVSVPAGTYVINYAIEYVNAKAWTSNPLTGCYIPGATGGASANGLNGTSANIPIGVYQTLAGTGYITLASAGPIALDCSAQTALDMQFSSGSMIATAVTTVN